MSFDREKQRKAGKTMTVASCIYGLIFSIVWCCLAAGMGAWFMLFFGIPFTCMTAYRLIMCIKLSKDDKKNNAADPWDRPAGQTGFRQEPPASGGSGYCPYCGASIQTGFQYCPSCGRRVPQ